MVFFGEFQMDVADEFKYFASLACLLAWFLWNSCQTILSVQTFKSRIGFAIPFKDE